MSALDVTMKDLQEQGIYQTERRIFKRGDVWMVDFGRDKKLRGEVRGYRPAVIIQNNCGNLHSTNKIVVPVTSSQIKIDKHLVTHAPVFIRRESVAQTELVYTVNEERFCKYVCTLTEEEMLDIEYRLLMSLGLTKLGNR